MNPRLTSLALFAGLLALSLVGAGRADDPPKKGFLGIQLRQDEDSKAVVIQEVVKGSPAEKAGLKTGDVVVKVGDTATDSAMSAVEAVGKFKPNDKVKIQVKRDGKDMTIEVTLGERPKDD